VTVRRPRPAPPSKLTAAEVEEILATPRSPRLVDRSPARVYFTLLDEGTYLASESTFYRVPRAHDSTTERRRQATHPPRTRPELVAHGLLVVWSWDITKLPGPRRGDSCDLYVVIDIFSRYAVAWCVAASEDGELARELIADAVARHQVPPGQLTIHPDRGSSMTPNPVTESLSFPGIGRSHSRPHVSDDNPYSQARLKTLKYCPAFPERLSRVKDARAFCEAFFAYYNHEHRHSGISYHTPAPVHYGTAEEVRSQRAATLNAAHAANRPGSAVHGRSRRSSPPWRRSTTPTRRSHRRRHRNVSQHARQVPMWMRQRPGSIKPWT
jgi:putative transposase